MKLAVLMMLGVFAALPLHADDTAALRAELEDLKAKAAALESARDSEASAFSWEGHGGGDLVSMKKKGRIAIGGEVHIDTVVVHRDDGGFVGKNDKVDSTTFYAETADLAFDIHATDDIGLHVLLDLTSFWDESADQDDLLAECYFLFDNAFCIDGYSVSFGKQALDYGMNESIGISETFNDGGVHWMSDLEAYVDNANPHDPVGTNDLPYAAPEYFFAIQNEYSFCDWGRVVAGVFQNAETTGGGRNTRGMHEDRSDDHLGFQSVYGKFEVTPCEGLMLQVSAINWHTDSFGDKDVYGSRAVDDKISLSVGGMYEFRCLPLTVWAEYQHGWDWLYTDGVDADVMQIAGIYGLCDNLDIGLMGDYARVNDALLRNEHEEYWQVAGNATYTLESGIYFTLEYAHVWYEFSGSDSAYASPRESDAIAFRTGWDF